jgi:SET domain-containing protein
MDFSTALRFLNFSENGNCNQNPDLTETCLTANRDIKAGEEILFNYLEVVDEGHFKKEYFPEWFAPKK